MATAAEILAQVAPTLADSPLAGGHLALAEMQTGQVFGDLRSYAVALLAAHTLAITTRGESDGGAAGAVTSQKEGQLAISYGGNGVVAAGSSNLSSTSYGLELDRIKRICVMGARSRLVI